MTAKMVQTANKGKRGARDKTAKKAKQAKGPRRLPISLFVDVWHLRKRSCTWLQLRKWSLMRKI